MEGGEEIPVRIFVGGGQEYYGPTSERDEKITRLIPEILYAVAPKVQVVTGGMPGIADIFSSEWARLGGSCLDVVSQEYHQEYVERETGRSVMISGMDQKHRRLRVSSLTGIACALFIQGGKYSTHEIKLFQEKGVPVVTHYGSGGAAGGQCPYEGWTYTPPIHGLHPIVSSTDPNETVFDVACVLAKNILHEISETTGNMRRASEEAAVVEEPKKKYKATDLTMSTTGLKAMDVDEDDIGGLMCVPPGMSAADVRSFNKMFLSSNSKEQSAMINSLAQVARASGATVVDLSIGEDGRAEEEGMKVAVAQIATHLRAQGARPLSPKVTTKDKGKEEERNGPVPVAFSIDIESRGDDLIKHGILSIGYCVGRLDREEVLERGRISLQPLQYLSYYQMGMLPHNLPAYANRYAFWSSMKHEMEEEGKTDHPEPPPQDMVATLKTQQFEEGCLDRFWLNEEKCPGGMEKMQTLIAEGVDPIQGIKQFRAILDKWDDDVNFKVKIISDNILFDGGWIDYYLSLAGRPRLHLDTRGRYRRVFDTVDYRRGVCHMDYGEKWMNEQEVIAHFGLFVNTNDHTHMPDEDAEYIYRFHVQMVNKISDKAPVNVSS